MNRSQLPRRIPRCALRPVSRLCARVFILLSDARVVALSARQWQSFHRRLSSLARNVAANAASSCSVPDSHQETFRFIRFTSLNPRGGTRRSMVKPIARETSVAQSLVCDWKPNVCLPHKQLVFTYEGKSSVAASCTRVSNAPAHVVFFLHSGVSVPHMRDSFLLPVESLRGLPPRQNCRL